MTYVVDIGICSSGGPVTNQEFLSEIVKIFLVHNNLHDTSNVNESLPSWRSTYQRYPLVKTRFWCYSIHGSVNDDPVQLLFCGDLTILLLGLIIYCLF